MYVTVTYNRRHTGQENEMTDTSPRRQTTMRMRADVMNALTEEAKERGWSRSQLVEQVLAQFLADNDRAVPVRLVL